MRKRKLITIMLICILVLQHGLWVEAGTVSEDTGEDCIQETKHPKLMQSENESRVIPDNISEAQDNLKKENESETPDKFMVDDNSELMEKNNENDIQKSAETVPEEKDNAEKSGEVFGENTEITAVNGIVNGSVNDNVTWCLDLNAQTLTITGNGEIDYGSTFGGQPWSSYSDHIMHVVVEEGITDIGWYVFAKNYNVETVSLPQSLKSIGYLTFSGCKFKSIEIPAKVEYISESAFDYCNELETISVDKRNTTYASKDGVLFNKAMNSLLMYPIEKPEVSYNVPDTVTEIGYGAFSLASHLSSLILPEGLNEIKECAFYNCRNLTSINIPSTVTFIRGRAFDCCTALEGELVLKNVNYLGSAAFANCDSIELVEIGNKTCYIWNFRNTIPDSCKLRGYKNSTCYRYAVNFGKEFIDIETGAYNDFQGDNQAYVNLLPTTGLSVSEPTSHSQTLSHNGKFMGYSMYIMHEDDVKNKTYMEIKAFTDNLVADCSGDLEKAKVISDWVSKNITYTWGSMSGNTIDGIYNIWKRRSGNCECYTKLTNYMLYLSGICPATVTGYGHEWSMALVDGKWISIDSTNGIFNADPNSYDQIEVISFASGTASYVVDNLSGIYLAGVGYDPNDSANVTNITIPEFVVGTYEATFDGCREDLVITGEKMSYAETYVKSEEYACIKYSNKDFTARKEHSYGTFKTTREATVLEKGEKSRICEECNAIDKAAVARLKAAIKLNASAIKLKVKQSTAKLKVTGLVKEDEIESWKSSNEQIVKVNSKGKITAQSKVGRAAVIVTLKSGLSKKITVKVQKTAVDCTKIILNKSSVNLKKGKSFTLKPVIKPFTCVQKIKYSSSDKKVVTVSKKGKLTAKKKGKATVTVTVGKKKKKCKITVR